MSGQENKKAVIFAVNKIHWLSTSDLPEITESNSASEFFVESKFSKNASQVQSAFSDLLQTVRLEITFFKNKMLKTNLSDLKMMQHF